MEPCTYIGICSPNIVGMDIKIKNLTDHITQLYDIIHQLRVRTKEMQEKYQSCEIRYTINEGRIEDSNQKSEGDGVIKEKLKDDTRYEKIEELETERVPFRGHIVKVHGVGFKFWVTCSLFLVIEFLILLYKNGQVPQIQPSL